MKIIFIYYDWIFNRNSWEKNQNNQWELIEGSFNDIQSIQWISEFCERFGYDIVLTGILPDMAEARLKEAGLREEVKIVGKIKSEIPTYKTIRSYLASREDVKEFVIVIPKGKDMDELMNDPEENESFKKNTIGIDPTHGFGETEFIDARSIALKNKYDTQREESKTDPGIELGKMCDRAVELLYLNGYLTTSLLQRTFSIGYGRSVGILEKLLKSGLVHEHYVSGRVYYYPNT